MIYIGIEVIDKNLKEVFVDFEKFLKTKGIQIVGQSKTYNQIQNEECNKVAVWSIYLDYHFTETTLSRSFPRFFFAFMRKREQKRVAHKLVRLLKIYKDKNKNILNLDLLEFNSLTLRTNKITLPNSKYIDTTFQLPWREIWKKEALKSNSLY